MTPEQAAWVREVVWPASWLRQFNGRRPELTLNCRCQYPCSLCARGRHSLCVVHDPAAPANDYQRVPRRETVLRFPNGAWASVWLADRACRSLCDCARCTRAHGHTVPVPQGQQLGLFETAA
jgi:hypothetical protein